jgi:hypothetical protein
MGGRTGHQNGGALAPNSRVSWIAQALHSLPASTHLGGAIVAVMRAKAGIVSVRRIESFTG